MIYLLPRQDFLPAGTSIIFSFHLPPTDDMPDDSPRDARAAHAYIYASFAEYCRLLAMALPRP